MREKFSTYDLYSVLKNIFFSLNIGRSLKQTIELDGRFDFRCDLSSINSPISDH